MSLPTQIGDKLAFHIEVVGTDARPVTDANEAIEAVVSVIMRSHPDNPAGSIIWIGDGVNQVWPLAVGEAFGLNVTRRGAIYVRGDRENLQLVVGAVLTSGKVPKQRIGV